MAAAMTTGQIAIVAPIAAAVLIAAINAWWQARVNSQTLEANRRLAVQERVRTTYEDMLHMVAWAMETVDEREPSRHAQPEPRLPGVERDHVRRVRARIGTHGSREVKRILEEWQEGFDDYSKAFELYQSALRGEKVDIPLDDLRKIFETSRGDLHRIVRELEDAVSDEMRA